MCASWEIRSKPICSFQGIHIGVRATGKIPSLAPGSFTKEEREEISELIEVGQNLWPPLILNSRFVGGHKAVDRPDPIPNSAVKRSLANGSGCIASARVGRRQFFPLIPQNAASPK